MKTLDETIFEAPYIMTPWEENAIYYLKEYRDHMKNEIIKLQEEVKKQKEMIEFLEKPLTWDELKQMEGKPVWIEFLNDEGEWHGEWCLIESSNDLLCEILRCKMTWWGTRKITLGKTWQAYRKERE